MNLQLHAIKTADIEQRVAKLEKLLADAEGNLDDNTKVPGKLSRATSRSSAKLPQIP